MVDFSDVIVNDGVFALSRINDHKIIIKNDNLSDFDLPGIKISVPQGTVSDFITQKVIKHATLLKYQTNADAFNAFTTKKTDLVVSDKSYIMMMNLMNQNKFHVFGYNLLKEDVALAFRKQDVELKDTFNTFLASWKKHGDLQKTYDYFFNSLAWHNH